MSPQEEDESTEEDDDEDDQPMKKILAGSRPFPLILTSMKKKVIHISQEKAKERSQVRRGRKADDCELSIVDWCSVFFIYHHLCLQTE